MDGIPLLDDRPIDFSGGTDIDGVPIVCFKLNFVACIYL